LDMTRMEQLTTQTMMVAILCGGELAECNFI